MEYLNENIDQMKTLNKIKGNVANELDNYRSIQTNTTGNTLIVEKSTSSLMKRVNRAQLNLLDDGYTFDNMDHSDNQINLTQENSFLQTITGLGKRLKQILTPKNDNSLAPRKFSDIKILHLPNKTTAEAMPKETLSERPHYQFSLLDKAENKYESVSNSLDMSNNSKSKDVEMAYRSNGTLLEEVLPANLLTESYKKNKESLIEQCNSIPKTQVDSPLKLEKWHNILHIRGKDIKELQA